MSWIKLGDYNSKYSSAVTKEQKHRKQILDLTSTTGRRLLTPDAIKAEIIEFYKGLMGSSAIKLAAINVQVLNNGPTLSTAQQLSLCAEVTNREIEGLKAIGDDKSSCVDGYNAFFFKKV